MDSDSFSFRKFGLESAGIHLFRNELQVRNHVELTAFKLRILVLQCVEAVRAGSQQTAEVVLTQIINVGLCLDLIEILFTDSAGKFGVAHFFLHHGKRQAGMLENLDHCLGNLLIAFVIGSRAADPIKNVVMNAGFGKGDV